MTSRVPADKLRLGIQADVKLIALLQKRTRRNQREIDKKILWVIIDKEEE